MTDDSTFGGNITLTRDDTASAKQIQLWKNGSIHTYFETTTSGLVFAAAGGFKPASHFDPADNSSYTLGTTSKRWSSVASVTGDFSGNATFGGIVSTSKIFEATGQNVSHGASRIKISQEDSATSEIRFWGANTSTAGSLRFLGSSSDGSVGGTRLTIDSSGNATFAGSLAVNGATIGSHEFAVDNGTSSLNRGNSAGDILDVRGENASQFKVATTAVTITPNATFAGDVGIGITPTKKLMVEVADDGNDGIQITTGGAEQIFLIGSITSADQYPTGTVTGEPVSVHC